MEKYGIDYAGFEQVKQCLISVLEERYEATDTINDLSELHHEAYNEDYFIIGYYQAEKFLSEHTTVFNAIGEIKEYEQNNFGEVTTDLSSSEAVVNMYAYIIGESIVYELSEGDTVGEMLEQLSSM